MRVTLDKGMLQRRLKVVERIVPRRGGLPFHYALYIRHEAGVVTFWAANAKEGYRFTLRTEATDAEDGTIAVPAQELIKAVAAAPGGEVTLHTVGGNLTSTMVRSGTARWTLEGLAGVAPQDWPGGIEVVEQGEINQTELQRVLEATRYAASKSESRPSFMQVHIGDGAAVAADGRRVHQESLGPVGTTPSFDLPERSVDTLLEALNAEAVGGQVQAAVDDDGAMSFRFAMMEYVVGRLNYEFPDIDNIVLDRARSQGGHVVCNVEALVSAIKVAVVAIEEGGSIELQFTNGVIEVRGSSQRSEGRMEVRCSNADVPSGTTLSVRAEDLLDVLGRITVDEDGDFTFTISLEANDPGWVYINEGTTEAAIRPVVT